MTDGPLVSICIPIYNDEEFVREALDSLVNQTYKNLEIIFSDNCSTDRSVEIIKSYKDPRIKLYSNEKNMGGKYNFENVFNYATGKYMTYIGADDALALDAFERAVTIMEDSKYQDVVLVNAYVDVINNRSERIYTKKYIFGLVHGRISSYWAVRSNLLFGSNILGELNGSLWKREAFLKTKRPQNGPINGNDWTSDLDIKLELCTLGNTYMIPKALGKFRVSAGSGSNANHRFKTAKMFRDYAYALHKDPRHKVGYGWVIIAAITSFLTQYARIMFYKLFIKKEH
jgi:glycosyltransferase involved in cell wall biosynthesis